MALLPPAGAMTLKTDRGMLVGDHKKLGPIVRLPEDETTTGITRAAC